MLEISNGDREPSQIYEQTIVAYISLSLLFVISISTIIIMKKKKEIINARGDILFYLIALCHFLSIFVPNLITVWASKSNSVFMCYFKYVYLFLFYSLTIGLPVLILFRSFFLKLKSQRKDLTNLRGILSSYVALLIFFTYYCVDNCNNSMAHSEYYYINYCTFPYINNQTMKTKDLLMLGVFLVSLWMMNYFKIWGIRQEMRGICLLHLCYMLIKGFHKKSNPKCYFKGELIENGYRLLFMFLNCVFFVFIYDDKGGLHRPVENMDLFKIDSWNANVLQSFEHFLHFQKDFDSLNYFKNAIENSKIFWREISKRESKTIF